MDTIRTMELPPDPERAIMGLRDTGYTFNTAIADIVDNSIAADATRVYIHINMDPDNAVTVYVSDNGSGMDEKGLINAMKYGSDRRKDPNSLGKFGLGLKTASTSFCRKLSVLSRTKDDNEVRKVQWDLIHVATTNKWELLFPAVTDDEIDLLEEATQGGNGTLVVWEDIDRFMNREYSSVSSAANAFKRKIDKLNKHLAMVFQRFLDPEHSEVRNVEIFLNDVAIKPWDPFCVKEAATSLITDYPIEIELEDSDKKMTASLKAYVLPRKEDFSSQEKMKDANISNDKQGFYVYRENRLIHCGDWMGMMTNEPHFSLLRIDFSFGHDFDELFNVDIKKSGIQLISEIYDEIKDNFLPAPRREAENRYRKAMQQKIARQTVDAHESSNMSIDTKAPSCEESQVVLVGKDEAIIKNSFGEFKHKISILSAAKSGEVRVVPVDTLDSGQLWEPAIVDGHHAIKLNKSHVFYKKVYYPVINDGFTVIGMDSLLWALGEAELSTMNREVAENYETLRFRTSDFLKKLLRDLPDPEIDDNE
ncbi:MAG TPA: ATP-binding protein [Rectinema sp.]|nr:ATP-binding protein [Rectinema sp.]